MSVISRSTSLVGRPALGRPAVACSSLLMILMMAVVPARADAAANASVTIQLLWQVQQGCATHCTATSQTQVAAQSATVLQIAATTDAGGTATNSGAVIQLIVQSQLGCVAFCSQTTRVQSASQSVSVTQLASAIADAAGASSANHATVSQLVFQYQDVCLEACDDVSATQVVTQAAATVQDADADLSGGPPLPPELQSFMTWLASVAGQAVVDVVQDRDVAACLSGCDGDVQVQISVQEADVAQVSVDVAPEATAGASTSASAGAAAVTVAAPGAPTAPVVATAAASKRKKKVLRPGHRGRWNGFSHRRPLSGGIHRER